MPRASTSKSSESSPQTPKKARASASPSKAKPTSPGIQKRREEWAESLPAPWVGKPDFKHPEGTRTVNKGSATKYKLNKREIETLPYELRLNSSGFLMKLYSENQLMELAAQKCAKLEVKLEIAGVIYHSHSGSSGTGSVSIISLKNPPTLAAWEKHIVNPQPPPLKLADYTCPPQPEKPDPAPIIWTPSKLSGPVSVADACRLYCLEPADIQDLSAHSPWIDLATVAKRALTLHGGFYAHEELVLQRREAEETELNKTDERKSRFRFSPMIQKEWEANDSSDDWMYEPIGPGTRAPKYRVAVFYPIESVCMDDYGCTRYVVK